MGRTNVSKPIARTRSQPSARVVRTRKPSSLSRTRVVEVPIVVASQPSRRARASKSRQHEVVTVLPKLSNKRKHKYIVVNEPESSDDDEEEYYDVISDEEADDEIDSSDDDDDSEDDDEEGSELSSDEEEEEHETTQASGTTTTAQRPTSKRRRNLNRSVVSRSLQRQIRPAQIKAGTIVPRAGFKRAVNIMLNRITKELLDTGIITEKRFVERDDGTKTNRIRIRSNAMDILQQTVEYAIRTAVHDAAKVTTDAEKHQTLSPSDVKSYLEFVNDISPTTQWVVSTVYANSMTPCSSSVCSSSIPTVCVPTATDSNVSVTLAETSEPTPVVEAVQPSV